MGGHGAWYRVMGCTLFTILWLRIKLKYAANQTKPSSDIGLIFGCKMMKSYWVVWS
jgi:hypothetical protein